MKLLAAGRCAVMAETAVQALGADDQEANEQGNDCREHYDAEQRAEFRQPSGISRAADLCHRQGDAVSSCPGAFREHAAGGMTPGALADLERDVRRVRQECEGPTGHAQQRDVHRQSTQDPALPGVQFFKALPCLQAAATALGVHDLDDAVHHGIALLSRGLSALYVNDLKRFGGLEDHVGMEVLPRQKKGAAQQQDEKAGCARPTREFPPSCSGH